MKLTKVHLKEFRSIRDANPFDVGDITCLVGKNEAGKTSVLQALYRLNPIVPSEGEFDVTEDYPRVDVEDYRQDVEAGKREPAVVVRATFALEDHEEKAIRDEFGPDALRRPEVEVVKGYTKTPKEKNTSRFTLSLNEAKIVAHLAGRFELPQGLRSEAEKKTSLADLAKFLEGKAQEQNAAQAKAVEAANALTEEAAKTSALERSKELAESASAKSLRAQLAKYGPRLDQYIWGAILAAGFPKFLYFDEYYQLKGHDNVSALKERHRNNALKPSDHPLLGLLALARIDLDKLLSLQRTQELKNTLQGTSNHLSKQILKYWSQNRHLKLQFDLRHAMAGDPEGMRDGVNIWGEVYDSKHEVLTGLGTRSRGFVWFFSFLAWYSAEKKKDERLVLLLDEPGLSLHGKAQSDLLRYFEEEILSNPKHQLIYTTHSPFMVDPHKFDRVRIVEDKSIDAEAPLPPAEDGTKVVSDVLGVGGDTLFPLQGALGYELSQSLFVGPNSLIVEGVSDLLYIQTISGLLEAAGRTGLDAEWTITPVGGSDKVPTFVALIGAQKHVNVATLIDFQKKDQQMIENIYKQRLLAKSHVRTYADFTGTTEADAEDMFGEAFYLDLVNGEYKRDLQSKLSAKDLASQHPRVLVRIEEHLKVKPMKKGIPFNHYRPARYFSEKVASLTVPADALDRFEAAFKALNALLK